MKVLILHHYIAELQKEKERLRKRENERQRDKVYGTADMRFFSVLELNPELSLMYLLRICGYCGFCSFRVETWVESEVPSAGILIWQGNNSSYTPFYEKNFYRISRLREAQNFTLLDESGWNFPLSRSRTLIYRKWKRPANILLVSSIFSYFWDVCLRERGSRFWHFVRLPERRYGSVPVNLYFRSDLDSST